MNAFGVKFAGMAIGPAIFFGVWTALAHNGATVVRVLAFRVVPAGGITGGQREWLAASVVQALCALQAGPKDVRRKAFDALTGA